MDLQTLPASHSATLPIPAQNLQAFLTSDPFKNWPNQIGTPPSKPALVSAATGVSISHARLRLDSLRVARGLRAIMGEPIQFVASKEPTPVSED